MDEEISAWRQVSGLRPGNRPERMISGIRMIGILCLALTAGCAGSQEMQPGVTPRPLIVAPSQPGPNPDAAVTAEPPLDVAALKARLRDTNAIGLFTKLALKNQVDDLLQQFRAHYLSGQKTSVTALRQPYDMLVLKVLALLQDRDPSLARTIAGSREAIWGILADRDKFNSVG